MRGVEYVKNQDLMHFVSIFRGVRPACPSWDLQESQHSWKLTLRQTVYMTKFWDEKYVDISKNNKLIDTNLTFIYNNPIIFI